MKTYNGAKAVLLIDGKPVATIKNITIDEKPFTLQPRLIINGVEVPWPRP